jgi:hypothetical protein
LLIETEESMRRNAAEIELVFRSANQTGAVLDPNRILVGSTSNFGAPLPANGGQQGSVLSIDPKGTGTLNVPSNFASSGKQASALRGAVQMFSANSPMWLNRVNNLNALTAQYSGVSNPLGLSNNNAFGRIWPANAPFGLDREGSSSILDPTGLPLKGAPNAAIGGVYLGNLTNRNAVTTPTQLQVVPGGLNTGAVGTALLGQSPDGTCKAVFAVVTADGAIVQEHTLKGLDGVAPRGTVRPILGSNGNAQDDAIVPRFGNATPATPLPPRTVSIKGLMLLRIETIRVECPHMRQQCLGEPRQTCKPAQYLEVACGWGSRRGAETQGHYLPLPSIERRHCSMPSYSEPPDWVPIGADWDPTLTVVLHDSSIG